MLSIQLALNGLSFWVDGAATKQTYSFDNSLSIAHNIEAAIECYPQLTSSYKKVNLIVDTQRVVYVPQDLFDEHLAESYITINSLQPAQGNYCVVSSVAVNGVCAAMALDAETVKIMGNHYDNPRYYSLLQENLLASPMMQNRVDVTLTNNIAYITRFDDALAFAEAIPFECHADLLCVLQQAVGKGGAHHIYIEGETAASFAKLCRRYFGSVSVKQPQYKIFRYEDN